MIEVSSDLSRLLLNAKTLLGAIDDASEQLTPDEDEAIRDLEAGIAAIAVSTAVVWAASAAGLTAAIGAAVASAVTKSVLVRNLPSSHQIFWPMTLTLRMTR